MPSDSRQVDVQQERGERNPTPGRGATPQELATAVCAGDGQLTEPKLLPDEQELRRIIDLIPQTIHGAPFLEGVLVITGSRARKQSVTAPVGRQQKNG